MFSEFSFSSAPSNENHPSFFTSEEIDRLYAILTGAQKRGLIKSWSFAATSTTEILLCNTGQRRDNVAWVLLKAAEMAPSEYRLDMSRHDVTLTTINFHEVERALDGWLKQYPPAQKIQLAK